jgi:hypothetical protein
MFKSIKEKRMKRILFVVTVLLLVLGWMSLNQHEVIKGGTVGKYLKPGAPVNFEYQSERVDVNETALVQFKIICSRSVGELNLQIRVDKQLEDESGIEREMTFEVTEEQREFPVEMELQAQENGTYYVRLLVKYTHNGSSSLRSYAIPVYVGEEKRSIQKSTIGTVPKLSISKAKESIRIIEE